MEFYEMNIFTDTQWIALLGACSFLAMVGGVIVGAFLAPRKKITVYEETW